MKKPIYLTLISLCILSCASQYKPAGFESLDEVTPYVENYMYYATRLSANEWSKFYKRFPNYKKDIENAKMLLGAGPEYDPLLSAYAFRWTTLNRKNAWPEDVLSRLSQHEIVKGDDIFKLVYSWGPPESIIWDNDFEILLFRPDKAIIMDNGGLRAIRDCRGCYRLKDESISEQGGTAFGDYTIQEVLKFLKLERPHY